MGLGKYLARALTMTSVAALTAGVGGLVVFNIATTIIEPGDPLWPEFRCQTGIPFQGDEACFDKKLNAGLVELETQFAAQKKTWEEASQQRQQELDTILKTKSEEIVALEAEKAEIARTRSQMQEQLQTLEALEKKSTSFTLFSSKEWKNGLSVVTGTRYVSFVKHQEWSKAWCYLNVVTGDGAEVTITFGEVEKGKAFVPSQPKPGALALAGLSNSDVEEARKLCQLPEMGA